MAGSQNGEIHSGVCIESNDEHLGFFQCEARQGDGASVLPEANLATAVRAVREMAKYGSSTSELVPSFISF